MADISKNIGVAAGAAVRMVAEAATLVGAVAKIVHDIVTKPKNGALHPIPKIYHLNNPLSLDQAVEVVTNSGFKPTVVPIVKPDSKYKDCIDMEVVGSNPTAGSKVAPGTSIIVNYVTADIIEKSRLIFETDRKKKEEQKNDRSKKRAKTVEKAKNKIEGVADRAKNGLAKILPKGKDSVSEETEETVEKDETQAESAN